MKIHEIADDFNTCHSAISWKDKIIFLEEYYTKAGNLSESNSESYLEQFRLLLNGTVQPEVGMKYIVMSLILVSDRIIIFQLPIVGKFISGDNKEMKFMDVADGGTTVFPPRITKRVQSTTATLVFDSVSEYEKTEMILYLKWDLQLPDIDLSLLKQ